MDLCFSLYLKYKAWATQQCLIISLIISSARAAVTNECCRQCLFPPPPSSLNFAFQEYGTYIRVYGPMLIQCVLMHRLKDSSLLLAFGFMAFWICDTQLNTQLTFTIAINSGLYKSVIIQNNHRILSPQMVSTNNFRWTRHVAEGHGVCVYFLTSHINAVRILLLI